MTFDFTNLRNNPPSGTQVVQADCDCFKLRHKKTGTVFTVRCTAPEEFSLYAQTQINEHVEGDGPFLMRSDLHRVLHLIGCAARPLEF